jgi:hypothetical protein
MKYKVGEKVRIESLDWYNANKICEISKFMQEQGIRSYVDCNGFRFLDVMCEYCGKILTIDSISECSDGSKRYIMREPAIGFGFTDDMIECLADEPQEKMVSLNEVCDMLYAMLSTQDINDYYYVTAPAYDTVEDLVEDFRKSFEE